MNRMPCGEGVSVVEVKVDDGDATMTSRPGAAKLQVRSGKQGMACTGRKRCAMCLNAASLDGPKLAAMEKAICNKAFRRKWRCIADVAKR